jgi:delta 1-pyrroline-5-carboxylate dehydrogenase
MVPKILRMGGYDSPMYTVHALCRKGNFVMPTVTRIHPEAQCVQHEAFVPILHTMTFEVGDKPSFIHSLTFY